jgi:hypothetical protein
VDGHTDAGWVARHAGQAPEVDGTCLVQGGAFTPGELVSVRVVGSQNYDLVVEPRSPRLPIAR